MSSELAGRPQALLAHLDSIASWASTATAAIRPGRRGVSAAAAAEPPAPRPDVPPELSAGARRSLVPVIERRAFALRGTIRADIGDCTRCKLHTLGRRQVVFGVGNPHADLMFVGEAPGADEDQQGEPFVGRAGQLLTKIIEAMGLTRDDVYIANVIKCRPPENRNPEPDEVATCQPFLFRQIDSIQPKVIVALGTFAAQALLETKDPISRLRGRVWTVPRRASSCPPSIPRTCCAIPAASATRGRT